MKIIKSEAVESDPSVPDEVAQVLADGGLVCLPCNGSYRILADFSNPKAVTKLFQSKRRTSKAPSLVFVDGFDMLSTVAADIDPLAKQLADRHWPGNLTILFRAHPDLSPKIRKEVEKAVGKIGVRVPDSDLTQKVLGTLGRPLLVSSANKQKKQGSGSPAQIRKNFVHKIDLFVDCGDLEAEPSSTVVDVAEGSFRVTRPGSVSEADLAASLEADT